MKTLVDVDFKWMINTCLKYARRQVIALNALKTVKDVSALFDVLKESTSEKEARERLMEEFGIEEIAAREILEMRLDRLSCLEAEKEIDYYGRVAAALSPLVKEIYGL